MSDVKLSKEARAEIDAFRKRLDKRGRRIEAARESLIQRVREAVGGYDSAYRAVPCEYMPPVCNALREYDRIIAQPIPEASAQPREGEQGND